MTKITLDLETTIRGDVGDKPSPWCPDNEIVMVGYEVHGKPDVHIKDNLTFKSRKPLEIVGQNIKFDALYMLTRSEGFKALWDEGLVRLHDTQLVEYLLSGQSVTYPRLDDMAVKYGGTLKDDRIKEFWDEGIDTNLIPRDMLADYLKHDVMNTTLVYKEQDKVVKSEHGENFKRLIETQMGALAATTEMEFNGMWFDKEAAMEEARKLQPELESLQNQLAYMMRDSFAHIEGFEVNTQSSQQIGAYLFGGQIKAKVRRPVLDAEGNEQFYKGGLKAGQLKTRLEEHTFEVEGCSSTFAETTAKGAYKVGVDELDKYAKEDPSIEDFVALQRKLADLSKYISTYLIGYSKKVCNDGCIHGKLSHVGTATGRLASSAPNLQNSDPRIRKFFKSRFGDDGVIVEIDWQQLEVAGAATITKDPNMIEDLLSGIDSHSQSASWMTEYSYEEVREGYLAGDSKFEKLRKQAKAPRFALNCSATI